jgi:hypothetical protein
MHWDCTRGRPPLLLLAVPALFVAARTTTSHSTATPTTAPSARTSTPAGDDRHRVGDAFDRAVFNPKVTVTLAQGDVAYAILATHDIGTVPATQCKPVRWPAKWVAVVDRVHGIDLIEQDQLTA